MEVRRNMKKTAFIDGLPIERLSLAERIEKFNREIGPELPRLSSEQIKLLEKFYRVTDESVHR